MAKPETLRAIAAMLRDPALPRPGVFKMDATAGLDDEAECGTAACIAGFVVLIEKSGAATMSDSLRELREVPSSLRALYMATDMRGVDRYDDDEAGDPALAAQAIDNYLAGQSRPWAPIFVALDERLAKENLK